MAASGPPPAGSSDLVCPWCSAALGPTARDCPSCGAQLIAEQESDLPGLTSVDARAKRVEPRVKQRSRLLSWISGDYGDDIPTKAEVQAVAPPDLAVQQEILRLQIAAELADLQAEIASFAADDLVETGRQIDPDDESDAEEVAAGDAATDGEAADAAPATAEAGTAAESVLVDAAASGSTETTVETGLETEARTGTTAPTGTDVADQTATSAVDQPGPREAPDRAAERESMRRELEAQIAELQARMDAIASDADGPISEDPA